MQHGSGILTRCTASTTPFGLVLGPTNPELTNIALGNLRLAACGILTHIIATYSDILTCQRSSAPLGTPSTQMTTLPYRLSWTNPEQTRDFGGML